MELINDINLVAAMPNLIIIYSSLTVVFGLGAVFALWFNSTIRR